MKYEFMAMGRIFLPLFAALVVISLVNSIFGAIGLSTPQTIGIVVSVFLMVGIAVITLIIILQRFWTNLLSNEGYLMMTLPVCPDKLIFSKLFTASVLSIASAVVVMIAILIMAITSFSFSDFAQAIRYIFSWSPFSTTQTFILAVELKMAIILSMFTNIMLLYACMSLSMVSNKHRWLVAIGAYIAITTAMQILAAIAMAIGAATGLFRGIEKFLLSFPSFGQIQLMFLGFMLLCAALFAAFYFTTRYMLKNRLNLQ